MGKGFVTHTHTDTTVCIRCVLLCDPFVTNARAAVQEFNGAELLFRHGVVASKKDFSVV